jgi:hypothetical protein
MTLNIETLKKTLAKLGYKWFNDRPNLIGIRSSLDVPDSFNDFFCVVYSLPLMPKNLLLKDQQIFLNKLGFKGTTGQPLKEDGIAGANTTFALTNYNNQVGKEIIKIYPITTDPGVYWLNNPSTKLGTAILKPNQWVDCWEVGFHQSKTDHRALVQRANVTVYRDSNKDNNYQLDEKKTETGLFGINIHGSGKTAPSKQIGKWSAGCQVFPNWSNKEEVIDICELFRTKPNTRFTYTLINEKDLVA